MKNMSQGSPLAKYTGHGVSAERPKDHFISKKRSGTGLLYDELQSCKKYGAETEMHIVGKFPSGTPEDITYLGEAIVASQLETSIAFGGSIIVSCGKKSSNMRWYMLSMLRHGHLTIDEVISDKEIPMCTILAIEKVVEEYSFYYYGGSHRLVSTRPTRALLRKG